MENPRFTFQENQFTGECLPCTAAQFKTIVSSGQVAWKIGTRQAVEHAIEEGQSLDQWLRLTDYRKFCLKQEQKPRANQPFQPSSAFRLFPSVQAQVIHDTRLNH